MRYTGTDERGTVTRASFDGFRLTRPGTCESEVSKCAGTWPLRDATAEELVRFRALFAGHKWSFVFEEPIV